MLNEKINYELLDELNIQDGRIGMYKGEEFLIVYDWNQVNALQDALGMDIDEATDGNWGFCDEYTTCSNCGSIIKTSPDSHSWTPDYLQTECDILCRSCITIDDVIHEIENDPSRANTIFSEADFIEAGYEKIGGDYQSGWYDRHDDPKKIYDKFKDQYKSIVFSVDSTGQFAVDFSAYGRN